MHLIADIQELSIMFESTHTTFHAVDNVSFQLLPEKTLAILGESGSGKSLTALSLLRLLPQHAIYGTNSKLFLKQRELLTLPEYQMRALRGTKIAIIFQDPMTALNPVLTIQQQLSEICLNDKAKNQKERYQNIIECLELVEIDNPTLRLKQYPHQLSGGQKQRIMIAMALLREPDILVADEPTTALDLSVQAQILKLLKKLQKEKKMSLLLITHDLTIVKEMADHVAVMYAGQIVETAPKLDFFRKPKHPYSQALIAAQPQYEQRGFLLKTIKGAVPSLDEIPSGCRFKTRCAYLMPACHHSVPMHKITSSHIVRCHFYPTLKTLPPLLTPTETLPPSSEISTSIMQVKNLSISIALTHKIFETKKPMSIVENVSFELLKGRILALIGESGSGKTTISRSMMGLISPTRGNIFYEGKQLYPLRKKILKNIRKKVQLIFQDAASAMNPRMIARDILEEGLCHLRHDEREKILKTLLDDVGLARNILGRYPHQFSGGQRQRLIIARALAKDPSVLICDEPTSALDVSIQAQILNLIKTLTLTRNLACLFITHNMQVVSWLADEVMVLSHGKIVENGLVETVLKKPTHIVTKTLLESVLSRVQENE